MFINQNKGFTLIELVIVIMLIGIIVVPGSRMISTGFLGLLASKNATIADWQGLVALERMSRDILSVRSPSDISSANASIFTFVDTNGSTISYTLSGTNLLRNSQPLAEGVNSLTFNYYDKNGVITAAVNTIRYIKVTLNITQSGANYNFSTSVYPRNLP